MVASAATPAALKDTALVILPEFIATSTASVWAVKTLLPKRPRGAPRDPYRMPAIKVFGARAEYITK